MTTTPTSELNVPAVTGIFQGDRPARYPNVAFVGKMGAGKTSAADIAVSYGISRVSFAQALKDIAAEIWGPDARTDRDKLQRLGVAVREIDPDAWANILFRAIEDVPEVEFVNDDCRFSNEYYGLKKLGFLIVEVTAPEEQRVDRLMRNGKLTDISQLDHESEHGLDGIIDAPGGTDYSVSNDGDMLQFEHDIRSILERERR